MSDSDIASILAPLGESKWKTLDKLKINEAYLLYRHKHVEQSMTIKLDSLLASNIKVKVGNTGIGAQSQDDKHANRKRPRDDDGQSDLWYNFARDRTIALNCYGYAAVTIITEAGRARPHILDPQLYKNEIATDMLGRTKYRLSQRAPGQTQDIYLKVVHVYEMKDCSPRVVGEKVVWMPRLWPIRDDLDFLTMLEWNCRRAITMACNPPVFLQLQKQAYNAEAQQSAQTLLSKDLADLGGSSSSSSSTTDIRPQMNAINISYMQHVTRDRDDDRDREGSGSIISRNITQHLVPLEEGREVKEIRAPVPPFEMYQYMADKVKADIFNLLGVPMELVEGKSGGGLSATAEASPAQTAFDNHQKAEMIALDLDMKLMWHELNDKRILTEYTTEIDEENAQMAIEDEKAERKKPRKEKEVDKKEFAYRTDVSFIMSGSPPANEVWDLWKMGKLKDESFDDFMSNRTKIEFDNFQKSKLTIQEINGIKEPSDEAKGRVGKSKS